MSDGKEVKLRTNPPKNCQYLTWCNDCEEAVPHEEGSCAGCASLDLVYFIKESDHDRIVAELRAEVERLKQEQVKYEADCKRIEYFDDLHEKVATQAKLIEKLKEQRAMVSSFARSGEYVTDDEIEEMNRELAAIEKEGAKDDANN